MKYLKKFENNYNQLEEDIKYLSNVHGPQIDEYIISVIDYYKLSDKQVNNLKLAVQYGYLNYKDFKNVVSDIINSGYVWSGDTNTERKFKMSYESNFKDRIINFDKPYKICVHKNQKFNLDSDDINSHNFNEIIGEIPKEYSFGKKYLIGEGRYRGENNDEKTLWEKLRNTKRESEYIRVVDEDQYYILTDKDIENIEIRKNANDYNL